MELITVMSNAGHTAESELSYWVALAHCPKLGPTRFALLRRHFPTMAEVWQANAAALKRAELDEGTIAALIQHRETLRPAESLARLEKLDISAVTVADSRYPALLKQIYDPPPVLFYRGQLEVLQNLCLAVVGTRRATSYGTRATATLIPPLAQAGAVIVSGLAYGIDAAAHRATLSVHGLTVAVLASGLDIIYPTAHHQLAQDIVRQGGLLVSEFAPGTPPLKQNFPYRNRIIAGLTRGTLVIEAAPGSGALVTAKHALEANREIFAIPGSIFSPASQGTNELLALGAHVVTEPDDILEVFNLAAETPAPRQPVSAEHARLLEMLETEPKLLDDLVRELKLSTADVSAALSQLELAGYVSQIEGRGYARVG